MVTARFHQARRGIRPASALADAGEAAQQPLLQIEHAVLPVLGQVDQLDPVHSPGCRTGSMAGAAPQLVAGERVVRGMKQQGIHFLRFSVVGRENASAARVLLF